VIWGAAAALTSVPGGARRTLSGAVQLARVRLSGATHWNAQPATIGFPAEWRDAWWWKPRSGLVSASQRGQTLVSTPETSGPPAASASGCRASSASTASAGTSPSFKAA
jgi:hypothetical protein